MTTAICIVECAWCRQYVSASLVEAQSEDPIVSHGACDACLLSEFMRQDAAEVEAA